VIHHARNRGSSCSPNAPSANHAMHRSGGGLRVLKSKSTPRHPVMAVVHRKRTQFPAVGRRGGHRRPIVIRFRVVDCFDELASVAHPRPSRLFFLLTSDRRHFASVSEILNVTAIRSTSLDGRPSSIQIPNPGIRTPGFEKPGACSPWDRVEIDQRLLEHNVFRAFRLPARIPSRNRCLPSFAARGMMTAVVLDDGRRRAVDRSQLGTMNHPMHREAAATSSTVVKSRAPPA
jgi:hypothetical protein